MLQRATALTAAEELHAEGSIAPVVAILEDEAAADAALVRQLVIHGVRAIVGRSQVATALGASIDAVRAGQVVFPAAAVPSIRPVFTVREKQVLGNGGAELHERRDCAEALRLGEHGQEPSLLRVREARSALAQCGGGSDPGSVNGLGTGILAISAATDVGPRRFRRRAFVTALPETAIDEPGRSGSPAADDPDVVSARLQVRGVSKYWRRDAPTLHEVDLTLPAAGSWRWRARTGPARPRSSVSSPD